MLEVPHQLLLDQHTVTVLRDACLDGGKRFGIRGQLVFVSAAINLDVLDNIVLDRQRVVALRVSGADTRLTGRESLSRIM